MAFFNDLVRVIAAVEGMEEMTVRGIGLSVRDAGHITKGGRGLSAAKMTVRDASNLLIGVNASDTARSAGQIIERYRECTITDRIGLFKDYNSRLSDSIALHTKFGTFLEALIEEHMVADDINASMRSMIDIERSEAYKKAIESNIVDNLVVEIIFMRPEPEVDIDFVGTVQGQSYGQLWFMSSGYHSNSDRRDSTRITNKTIKAVAQTLSN